MAPACIACSGGGLRLSASSPQGRDAQGVESGNGPRRTGTAGLPAPYSPRDPACQHCSADRRHRQARHRRFAPRARRNSHPGNRRVGEHAGHRCRAQPARRGAARRESIRDGDAEGPSASASFLSPARPPWFRGLRSTIRRSRTRSTGSGSGRARTSTAASLCRWPPCSRRTASSWSTSPMPARRVRLSDKPHPEQSRQGSVEPGSYRSGAIVLLSDGQRTMGGDPIDAAQMAVARGVKVYTVGLGTPEGSIISFRGWSIRVKLDERTLKEVARMTGAQYFNANSAEALRGRVREPEPSGGHAQKGDRAHWPRCACRGAADYVGCRTVDGLVRVPAVT